MRSWEYGDGAPGSEDMILDIVERCKADIGGERGRERGGRKRAWDAGPGYGGYGRLGRSRERGGEEGAPEEDD